MGVIIDDKLTFDKHICSKVNIANRNLGLIFKTFNYLNKDMFLTLYKSLIRPHLEYASVIWTPRFKKHTIQIENVQRRATRLLKELQGLDYSERLLNLGLPTLEYRRERADLIQVYKIDHKIDRTEAEVLSEKVTRPTRGHTEKFFKPRARCNIRKNSFKHRVVDNWNNLDQSIVDSPSLNAFKARLNKSWKKNNKFHANCYRPY